METSLVDIKGDISAARDNGVDALREFISKHFKDVTGKGPARIAIKQNRQGIFREITGFMITMERKLLGRLEGKEAQDKVKEALAVMREEYIRLLEAQLKVYLSENQQRSVRLSHQLDLARDMIKLHCVDIMEEQ